MTKKEIGAIISAKIEEKKVTYYYINQCVAVQQHVVKAIEKGEGSYTIDSLVKVAEFLGVRVVVG